MSAVLLRLGLRSLAVIIAVAAAMDPAWSTMQIPPKRLVAIRMTSSDVTPHLTALRSAFVGWELVSRELTGTRVPCDPAEACVLIADGSIDGDPPLDHRGPLALLDVRDTRAPGTLIRAITAYDTHQSASGVIHVELERRTITEPTTLVTVSDGTAIVGSAKATWGRENRTEHRRSLVAAGDGGANVASRGAARRRRNRPVGQSRRRRCDRARPTVAGSGVGCQAIVGQHVRATSARCGCAVCRGASRRDCTRTLGRHSRSATRSAHARATAVGDRRRSRRAIRRRGEPS